MTSAFTVAGPFAVPATVAVLVTFARLMATAAPIAAGGARAAVAVPSAFALASVLADDQTVSPPEPMVTPAGRLALEVVFEMFTEIAAATVTEPPEVLAGGAAGSEPDPVVPFVVAVLFTSPRWLRTCASGAAPPPELCDPFAADVAVVCVVEAPEARNSTRPAVSKLLSSSR